MMEDLGLPVPPEWEAPPLRRPRTPAAPMEPAQIELFDVAGYQVDLPARPRRRRRRKPAPAGHQLALKVSAQLQIPQAANELVLSGQREV